MLLMLPQASADHHSAGFVDALFTSTSASCVTGLIVRNTATGWSAFGKCVIIGLIQIGGLGTMTMIMWISIFTGQRISLTSRLYIREQLNADSLTGLVRLIKFATLLTLAVEGAGALYWRAIWCPSTASKRESPIRFSTPSAPFVMRASIYSAIPSYPFRGFSGHLNHRRPDYLRRPGLRRLCRSVALQAA